MTKKYKCPICEETLERFEEKGYKWFDCNDCVFRTNVLYDFDDLIDIHGLEEQDVG